MPNKETYQNKLCACCGAPLKSYKLIKNIITGDFEKVCLKCAQVVPEIKYVSIDMEMLSYGKEDRDRD